MELAPKNVFYVTTIYTTTKELVFKTVQINFSKKMERLTVLIYASHATLLVRLALTRKVIHAFLVLRDISSKIINVILFVQLIIFTK